MICWINPLLLNSKQFPWPWSCKAPAPKSQEKTVRVQWPGLRCRQCGSVRATENIRLGEWICQIKSAAIHTAQPIPRRPSKWSDDAEDLWFPQYCCNKLLSTLASEGWAYFSGEDQGKSGMAVSQSQEEALSKDERSEIGFFWRLSYIGPRWQTGIRQHSSTDELAGAKSEPKKEWKSPPPIT